MRIAMGDYQDLASYGEFEIYDIPVKIHTKLAMHLAHNGEVVKLIGRFTDAEDYHPCWVVQYKDGVVEEGYYNTELEDIFNNIKEVE